ncbi:ABC transporter substrate-binding protein [Actinoallomurus soli]|uniref:ABC transporter substrate-binding protein n=1 Tax=Actinoallomurus soli TaxID=2952535 RepID=UPI002092965D|nr:sugar ABC transporter substrate-binding protein [Actinoallomurus soli]MCO5972885.1 sugar ABC transporter substrate-binding protein [Actinoallomurus soli]
MRTRARWTAALIAAVLPLATTACSSGGSGSSNGPVTLTYALWDNNQQPAYQACADAFTAAHPDIHVKITQSAWNQYWQNLTTQMTSGNAPDVFTDHVAYYPQFVKNNQILDITSRVAADKVDLNQYQGGLADLWVKDGKRYGLPKDWDTVAIAYNTGMLKSAHVDPAGLANLTWNPTDGGTFEQLIAKLTVDQKGHNGLDPSFDKNHVKIHGIELIYDDGATGQSTWGNFAVANGFTFLDKNPFGTKYHYSDPALAQTVDWFASLAKKGYAAPYDKASTLGPDAVLNAGRAAMTMTGSWNINTYLGSSATQKFAFAPLPAGPRGRKTFINGLSDAIYTGTKHPDQAWQWVKFLASTSCQDIVASKGVVFPAIKTSSQKALATHQAAGRNVKVFVDEATTPGETFSYPITDHADQITQEVQTDLEGVWLGKSTAADALAKAQKAVDGFMSQP